jgi:hypothetical protein
MINFFTYFLWKWLLNWFFGYRIGYLVLWLTGLNPLWLFRDFFKVSLWYHFVCLCFDIEFMNHNVYFLRIQHLFINMLIWRFIFRIQWRCIVRIRIFWEKLNLFVFLILFLLRDKIPSRTCIFTHKVVCG